MKCIAIDDEPLALNIIENFCAKVPFLKLCRCFNSAIDALEYLRAEPVDLMFLDINMPHITGVEFARVLDTPPMIIFTTAYQDYALTGFELNAIDYIVKPFSFDRFLRAVNKAYELQMLRETASVQRPDPDRYIMIKVEYSTVKVFIKDITYIEGLKDYIRICTPQKNFVTKSTMKNIVDKLPANEFIRIHKSFIVSIDKITSFENNHIHLANGSEIVKIPLGSQYRDSFSHFLEQNKL